MRTILLLLTLFLLAGCGGPSEREQRTGDLAATGFEAATAIEQGVTPELPLHSIKEIFATIIFAQGLDYEPARPYIQKLIEENKKNKETKK